MDGFMPQQEIPVYLFTGFLESGKTKFIQSTLEDIRFNAGERTLVLMCEEGIEELEPKRFKGKNVFIENIEGPDEINMANLVALAEKHGAERVMIEYNGMWMLNELFTEMPENWLVYQEFSFANSQTFMSYNTNMRQLTYDKLQSCDVMVFNRYSDDIDMMELHKVVRGASRRAEIVYEYPTGDTIPDNIEDPLPFDLDADIVEIEDRDYAWWYRDMGEEMDKYQDKVVRFKAITANSSKLPKGTFVVGRQLMSCCIEDIQMAGLACEKPGKKPDPKQWLTITAKIDIARSPAYGSKIGPVLHVLSYEPAEAPEQEVATFF